MSAIQDLSPFIGAFPSRIRKAKDESGMTVEDLAEKSGVSFSAVSRLYSGTQANPQLYNSAAMCDVLGLSLDELFGLRPSVGSPGELQAKVHELEVENARLTATNKVQRTQIKSAHSICYILVFFCVFFAMAIIAYLVFDAKVKTAGLIQDGKLSIAALVFICLIVASIVTAGIAIVRIMRRENKEDGSCSNV